MYCSLRQRYLLLVKREYVVAADQHVDLDRSRPAVAAEGEHDVLPVGVELLRRGPRLLEAHERIEALLRDAKRRPKVLAAGVGEPEVDPEEALVATERADTVSRGIIEPLDDLAHETPRLRSAEDGFEGMRDDPQSRSLRVWTQKGTDRYHAASDS
jgi:hypothetical protein